MNVETVGQPRRRPKWLLIGGGLVLALIVISQCASEKPVDPKNWTCEELADSVMKMSKERSPQILEISKIREVSNMPGYRIDCYASAEWSEDYGDLKYGARVNESGTVMLEYTAP